VSFNINICIFVNWASDLLLSRMKYNANKSQCIRCALTARRKLNELFVQFDNVTTACQFHNAVLDSLTCINDALSSEETVNIIFN